jgi:hypothetical protein
MTHFLVDSLQWAGKTIALGTFPSAEADEKCARAKALTRAWRSTMRPKPTREWVMAELERIGVRVVSGRLTRTKDDEGEDGDSAKPSGGGGGLSSAGAGGGDDPAGNFMGNGGGGWGADDLNNLIARRNSTLGMSMMDQGLRRGSLGIGSMVGFDGPGGGMGAGAFDPSHQQMARRASSLGLGTLAGGGLGMPVNPNQ